MHFTGQGQGRKLIHFPGSSIPASDLGVPQSRQLASLRLFGFSSQPALAGVLGRPGPSFHGCFSWTDCYFSESNNVIFPDGRGSQEVIGTYETQGAYPRGSSVKPLPLWQPHSGTGRGEILTSDRENEEGTWDGSGGSQLGMILFCRGQVAMSVDSWLSQLGWDSATHI